MIETVPASFLSNWKDVHINLNLGPWARADKFEGCFPCLCSDSRLVAPISPRFMEEREFISFPFTTSHANSMLMRSSFFLSLQLNMEKVQQWKVIHRSKYQTTPKTEMHLQSTNNTTSNKTKLSSNNHSYLPKTDDPLVSTFPLRIFPLASKVEFSSEGITPAIYVSTILVMRSIWSMVGTHSKVTAASASSRDARQKHLLQLCMFDLLSSFIKYGVMDFRTLNDGKQDTLQLSK